MEKNENGWTFDACVWVLCVVYESPLTYANIPWTRDIDTVMETSIDNTRHTYGPDTHKHEQQQENIESMKLNQNLRIVFSQLHKHI